MISSINSYTLDTDVRSYGAALIPFNVYGYRWAIECGRMPIYRSEKYYWTENNIFMGKEGLAMIAAIKNMISKISFRFSDTNKETCLATREKLYYFIYSTMGKHDEIYVGSPNQKTFTWKDNGGNVMLEIDEAFTTEIVLTSSALKKAKKRLFFRFKA